MFEAEGSQCSDTLIINTTIVIVKEKERVEEVVKVNKLMYQCVQEFGIHYTMTP